ncbi:MAG: phosphoribosylaminoimidazolesuccinocarboxamide synthase [Proteobacteria bacterium SG_bin7]|nr:MAG: phosphoribosylaminoimidazolesuccinocarboxamide synthase [Proteobacteria bacterium SG_bin7]
MSYQKGSLLYEGKGKKVYSISGDSNLLYLEFKDQLTAFNAQKKGEFQQKGELNRDIASLIFRHLAKKNIPIHWVADVGAKDMVVKKLKMIPLEVVVRNVIAGSLAKKLGREEGERLQEAVIEFFYKDDALGDPFINDHHALMLKAVEKVKELDDLRWLGNMVNECLKQFFAEINIDLVDFKLEFGISIGGQMTLGDEITPDSCRLWDRTTGEKLDKDRFRRDLGKVKESYQEVFDRIKNYWGGKI